MIGGACSSLGTRAALIFGWAVYCCWNSVRAVGGSQVPAGCATSVHALDEKWGARTALYPWANRVALLSVGSPRMTMTFGLATFQALTQLTSPLPIRVPTSTLLKLT